MVCKYCNLGLIISFLHIKVWKNEFEDIKYFIFQDIVLSICEKFGYHFIAIPFGSENLHSCFSFLYKFNAHNQSVQSIADHCWTQASPKFASLERCTCPGTRQRNYKFLICLLSKIKCNVMNIRQYFLLERSWKKFFIL